MGIVDSLLGSGEREDSEDKYAIMINAGPDDPGPSVNAFEYARDLDEGGHHVEVYLDGVATKWPGELAQNPDHPLNDTFDEVAKRGLIRGACGACAAAFDSAEECQRAGIDVATEEGHSPEVSDLASEGYELMVVG